MAGKNKFQEKEPWNVAVISLYEFMVAVHGSVFGQLMPFPFQPLNMKSPSGMAVRVTGEAFST